MTALKLIAATTLALTLLTLGMASTAHANTAEQNQKLEQEFEVECNSGSYGQNTTCKVKGKQTGEQHQRIHIDRNGLYHKPANTALDMITAMTIGALITAGASAAVIKSRTK